MPVELVASIVTAKATHRRLAWLEVAKGLGIVLLVVLHVESDSDSVYGPQIVWFLKLFRMPMFFIIAGLLFSPRRPSDLIERKARSLLVPYVSFLVLVWTLLLLRQFFTGEGSRYLSYAGIRDLAWGGESLTREYGVFWFMTCLFFTQIVFNALVRRWGGACNPNVIGFILLTLLGGCALSRAAPNYATPLAIGAVPLGLPFIWFGNFMQQIAPPHGKMWLVTLAVLAVALTIGYLGVHYNMDIKRAEPGAPVISIALAIVLTWIFFEIARYASGVWGLSKVLTEIGGASIVVMFLHQFIHFTIRHAGVHSDLVIISAGVAIPYLCWRAMNKSRLLSGLFLGTAATPQWINRLLKAFSD